jgi:hypothetical protein
LEAGANPVAKPGTIWYRARVKPVTRATSRAAASEDRATASSTRRTHILKPLKLIAATHNLLKLWRAGLARAGNGHPGPLAPTS